MITRATRPTILVTVGIAIQQVTSTLLSRLFGLLQLLFELLKFLGQISHLAGITAALGLTRLAYLLAVLVKPMTLTGAEHGKGPTHRLAPLAVLGSTYLLGGWTSRTAFSSMFSGHVSTFLGGCVSLGLAGAGYIIFSTKTFSVFSRLWSIDLGDFGTVLWFFL